MSEFSKDLANRSKKYDKYKVTILTKEMQMYEKLFELAKSYWANIVGLWTSADKLRPKPTGGGVGPAKEKQQFEFTGVAEAWKRVQLAGLGTDSPIMVQKKQLDVQKKQLVVHKETKQAVDNIVNRISWAVGVFTGKTFGALP